MALALAFLRDRVGLVSSPPKSVSEFDSDEAEAGARTRGHKGGLRAGPDESSHAVIPLWLWSPLIVMARFIRTTHFSHSERNWVDCMKWAMTKSGGLRKTRAKSAGYGSGAASRPFRRNSRDSEKIQNQRDAG